jgi:hypothetical protein
LMVNTIRTGSSAGRVTRYTRTLAEVLAFPGGGGGLRGPTAVEQPAKAKAQNAEVIFVAVLTRLLLVAEPPIDPPFPRLSPWSTWILLQTIDRSPNESPPR